MSIRLGIVMDPIEGIDPVKDSSLAMLLAAQARGWSIQYMQQTDLYLLQQKSQGQAQGQEQTRKQGQETQVRARMRGLSVKDDPQQWFELGEAADRPLAELDVILMRKDPPFDMDYIYATYLLELAQESGCLVVNEPRSLRDCNEKLFAVRFPQCCPPLLVSAAADALKAFHATHQDVVYKPLDGMGGSGVFRVQRGDPNLGVVIETLSGGGRTPIMAQCFVPEISEQGDKRILLIDGEPADHGLARIPPGSEIRGNLAIGAKGAVRPLSERDRWICGQVAPELKERGLLFVGLDVIGDYLTEINVTSPTCIREIDRGSGSDIGGDLMDCIAARLKERTR